MSQVVLITGADRGLGFALTKDFLARGDVVFAGQFMEEWGELEELQGNYPDRLHRIPLDSRESIPGNGCRKGTGSALWTKNYEMLRLRKIAFDTAQRPEKRSVIRHMTCRRLIGQKTDLTGQLIFHVPGRKISAV